MQGHIKVTKIYDDHKEVVLDDNNLLTAGIAVEIVDIMTGDIGLITPIKPAYLQVGTGKMNLNFNDVAGQEGSSIFYHLSAPLTTAEAYGDETSLELNHLYRSFIASSFDLDRDSVIYEEMLFSAAPLSATTVSSTSTKEWFGVVEPVLRTKIFIDTFEVRLKLDRKAANGQVLTEFGLFAKNPFGYKDDTPLLLAYKKLQTSITKREDFDLLIEWSIGFVGNPGVYDNVTPGSTTVSQEVSDRGVAEDLEPLLPGWVVGVGGPGGGNWGGVAGHGWTWIT